MKRKYSVSHSVQKMLMNVRSLLAGFAVGLATAGLIVAMPLAVDASPPPPPDQSQGCNSLAIKDFAGVGKTYSAELDIPYGQFLRAVCQGQDFPVVNSSYVVNSPAGTNLPGPPPYTALTTAYPTKPGHIYWIQVQGTWRNGSSRQVDASYISDDNWATHQNGPSWDQRNLETQVNDQFVNWGPYNSDHSYSYWVMGNGQPINLRVFDGNPVTNTPNPAWYHDNVAGPVAPSGTGMSALVFEYALPH